MTQQSPYKGGWKNGKKDGIGQYTYPDKTTYNGRNAQQIKDTKTIDEFNKTENNFKKIKEELDKITKEHKQMKDEIVKGQTTLHGIRKQQVEVGKELDEANSRL